MSSSKRVGYQDWIETFIKLAKEIANRSKDPNSQVGACIVDCNNRVVSLGYNGFPDGCSDDVFPWSRESKNNSILDVKYTYVVHAELNAILNSKRDISGCAIFVTMFPCHECCKAIIQSGIQQVVYETDKYENTESVIASKFMFHKSGVKLFKYNPEKQSVDKFKWYEFNQKFGDIQNPKFIK